MYQNINSNIFKNIVSNRGHISTVSHKNIPRRPVREFISKVRGCPLASSRAPRRNGSQYLFGGHGA